MPVDGSLGSFHDPLLGGSLVVMATQQPSAIRRFTADEVWRMLEIGLLHPDEPYELIDGQLRYVSPQSPRHAGIIAQLSTVLMFAYSPARQVRVQLPIGGITDQIPEPDLAVAPAPVSIDAPHPRASETLLLIEVSESSVAWDVRKGRIYALGGAPLYWRIEVLRQVVVVHQGPRADGTWDVVSEVAVDGALVLPGIDQTLAVARIFEVQPQVPPG